MVFARLIQFNDFSKIKKSKKQQTHTRPRLRLPSLPTSRSRILFSSGRSCTCVTCLYITRFSTRSYKNMSNWWTLLAQVLKSWTNLLTRYALSNGGHPSKLTGKAFSRSTVRAPKLFPPVRLRPSVRPSARPLDRPSVRPSPSEAHPILHTENVEVYIIFMT